MVIFKLPFRHLFISFLLGLAQTIAFGTSLYLLTVLGAYISRDLALPLSLVAFGMTFGILCGALIYPHVGRFINHGKGRQVLVFSALSFALGLIIIANSHSVAIYIIGWGFMGCAMASGLYDAVFSQLGLVFGKDARPMISLIALCGGFASTIFWIISGHFVHSIGWREACLIYAALHIFINLPIYLFVLPICKANAIHGKTSANFIIDDDIKQKLMIITSLFMCETLVAAIIGVHIVNMLSGQGIGVNIAVAMAAIIGPSQVVGRFIELSLGHKIRPITTVSVALFLIIIGLLLIGINPQNALWYLMIYGVGIGVLSIARGTLPLETFDAKIYPLLMGKMARPIAITQALAPTIGALLVARFDLMSMLLILCFIVALSLAASLYLRYNGAESEAKETI